MDFLKSWDELTNQEKWDFEDDCQAIATKEHKKFCKKSGMKFEQAGVVRIHDASEEWYFRHMDAKRAAYIEAHRTPEERARLEAQRIKKELTKARKQLVRMQ